MEVVQLIFVRTAYYVHQHCFSAHCTKWLFRVTKLSLSVKSKPNVTYLVYKLNLQKCYDSGGIRTHAPEENSALDRSATLSFLCTSCSNAFLVKKIYCFLS